MTTAISGESRTRYPSGTPRALRVALEAVRLNGVRVRLEMGDTELYGYVSRSRETLRPVLMQAKTDEVGVAFDPRQVVRVWHSNRTRGGLIYGEYPASD